MSQERVGWECPPKVVLVGVDFGSASAQALAIAGTVAERFDARLRVVHAERFEPPPYFTLEQIAQLEADRHTAQAAALAHLTQFAAGATAHPVEPVVADAPPVEALLNAAARADLIVLGTHGRTGPGRWWLGSVAERIVRAAAVPVLVTRATRTPARQIFERLALVDGSTHPNSAARTCAEHLARLAGGTVSMAGRIAQCDAAVLEPSTLVVVATPADRGGWGVSDTVARVLGRCDRPVLFIRETETKHEEAL